MAGSRGDDARAAADPDQLDHQSLVVEVLRLLGDHRRHPASGRARIEKGDALLGLGIKTGR